jgi:hypothetical protein
LTAFSETGGGTLAGSASTCPAKQLSPSVCYYGEGQVDDMTFTGGNRAIRDHAADGSSLHLFKKVRDRFVRYAGEYSYVTHSVRPGTPDRNGDCSANSVRSTESPTTPTPS